MSYYDDWGEELKQVQKDKFVYVFNRDYVRFAHKQSEAREMSLVERALKKQRRNHTHFADEIDEYLRLPNCSDSMIDIIDWWRMNQNTFPALARMARDYFAIQVGELDVVDMWTAFETERRSLMDCVCF